MISITHQISKISFGTTDKLKNNPDGSFVGYYTNMFREDLDWDKFKSYINSNYNNGANIDIFACSDGSEAYSTALKLDNPKHKISASDLEPENIAMANRGLIELKPLDLGLIQRHTNQSWHDFFVRTSINNQYRVNDALRNRVKFSVFDIKRDFEHYSFPKDTVCMIRNTWYHFNYDEHRNILGLLHDKLPIGSTFVIGEQEQMHNPQNFPRLIAKFFNPISDFVNKNGYYLFRK